MSEVRYKRLDITPLAVSLQITFFCSRLGGEASLL